MAVLPSDDDYEKAAKSLEQAAAERARKEARKHFASKNGPFDERWIVANFAQEIADAYSERYYWRFLIDDSNEWRERYMEAFIDPYMEEVARLEKEDETKQQVEAEITRMDAAFANLERIEESYRRNFGPIPPINER